MNFPFILSFIYYLILPQSIQAALVLNKKGRIFKSNTYTATYQSKIAIHGSTHFRYYTKSSLSNVLPTQLQCEVNHDLESLKIHLKLLLNSFLLNHVLKAESFK